MRILFTVLLILFSLMSLTSQRVIKPKLIEVDWKGILYKKEWSIDMRLYENGAALAYNTGKIKSYYKTNFYHIELGFTKDPREKSQSKVSSLGQSGTYSFGKINSVINLRGGIGSKVYLSEKEKRNGLAVGYVYEIGPSLALLKPYYLDLIYVETIDNKQALTIKSERFSEDNRDKFLDPSSVNTRSSFFRGFDQLAVKAGIQGKLGAHIAIGAFDKYVKAFETGVMFDIYASKIPILLETENISNKRFFFRLYMNLQLGRRSN